LSAVLKWSLKEHVSRLQDPHHIASEAHVTRMMPPTGLLGEQR